MTAQPFSLTDCAMRQGGRRASRGSSRFTPATPEPNSLGAICGGYIGLRRWALGCARHCAAPCGDDGIRTHANRLEAGCSTIELHPLVPYPGRVLQMADGRRGG